MPASRSTANFKVRRQTLARPASCAFAGEQLACLPSQVIGFADFAAEFPDVQVLARPAFPRSYGVNPYTLYDSGSRPFLFCGETDPHLPAMERIVGVALAGGS